MSSASAVRLSPSVQKQKLKLELLRGSRLKLESLPVSVVVHEHLVRAGCMFFGTTTRRTLTRLHRHAAVGSQDASRHAHQTQWCLPQVPTLDLAMPPALQRQRLRACVPGSFRKRSFRYRLRTYSNGHTYSHWSGAFWKGSAPNPWCRCLQKTLDIAIVVAKLGRVFASVPFPFSFISKFPRENSKDACQQRKQTKNGDLNWFELELGL